MSDPEEPGTGASGVGAGAGAGQRKRLRRRIETQAGTLRDSLRKWRALTGKPPQFFVGREAARLAIPEGMPVALYSCREAMIAALARGPLGAELGVQHGRFSRFLLDNTGVERLHLFDQNVAQIARDVAEDPRTVVHRGDSSRKLAALTDLHFDWIYVDGDHGYRGVRRDALAALVRLKPGGLLAFNDYIRFSAPEMIPYGVVPAVNELVNAGAANGGVEIVALALSPHGYWDIALRKSGEGPK